MMAVSVLVGLGAVLLAAQWVNKQSSIATAKVVVAAKDIDVGSRLATGMLQVVEWPQASAVKGAFTDPAKLDTRVVNTSILRGEPVIESKLAPLGSKGGLSAVIVAGRRAMTVKVNEVVGVAGFALPGNFVDIMVNVQDDKSKAVSKIVLEQILVLAVAQDQVVRDEGKAKVVSAVTLEVTPEQAEKLDLARSVGNLSLVLRNQVDRAVTVTGGARTNDLLAGAAQADARPDAHPALASALPSKAPVRERSKAAPAPRAQAPASMPAQLQAQAQVEVIRGIQRSHVEAVKPE